MTIGDDGAGCGFLNAWAFESMALSPFAPMRRLNVGVLLI
jgi:hypothetical protein